MSYSQLILKDKPDIVWGFDDINESSSVSYPINFITTGSSDYSASINANNTNVLNIPIIYGGNTALKLTSSSIAGISIPTIGKFSELYKTSTYSIEFWIQLNKVPNTEITLVKKRNYDNVGLFLKENYLMFRYGNSSKYVEVLYGLAELNEPTHIAMIYSNGFIQLFVNGIASNKELVTSAEQLLSDSSLTQNDVFDFYGHESINVFIDAVSIYSYSLNSNKCKKHYMYGLAKSVDENIFIARGGDFYNTSTRRTKKSYFDYWQSPKEWRLASSYNTLNTRNGIKNIKYSTPVIGSLDNNINKNNNKISFSSTSSTNGSYIDISNLQTIISDNGYPFFAKITFDGQLPSTASPQTIMSYAIKPFTDIIKFQLKNNSGSYYMNILDVNTSSAISFYIPNITSSPTAYIGMKYENMSIFYFALSGSSIQSASFLSDSSSAIIFDKTKNYFPPGISNIIRIGSNYSYNTTVNPSSSVNQFYGTFLKFLVTKNDFSASTYLELDSYKDAKYEASYETSLSRFKVFSYGTYTFYLHGPRIAQLNTSGSSVISSNRFEFGYPDVISGSQVQIYATLYNYSGSVINTKTLLQKVNSLEWLNLINLKDKYIKFDIELRGNDITEYPPVVKYFKAEAFSNGTSSYTEIIDNSGSIYKITNNASAQAFIPEFYETSSIFLTENSGIRSYRNYIDFKFKPEKIGTLGFYIRFNESASSGLKFLEIFSSSAASLSLFVASVNSSNNMYMSPSSTYYLNGASATSIYSDNWAHVIFTFNPKLQTSSANNFLIRFGNSQKSDFYIQNIYILDNLFGSKEAEYMHNSFTGGSAKVSAGDSSSYSIFIFDKYENINSSSLTKTIYQPFLSQTKFLSDVKVAIDSSASTYINNVISGDQRFFDGIQLFIGDRLLSILDNKVYEVNSNGKLSIVTSSSGDYVKVLLGNSYGGYGFVNNSGSFTLSPLIEKIDYYLENN